VFVTGGVGVACRSREHCPLHVHACLATRLRTPLSPNTGTPLTRRHQPTKS
jgi:hypothetical protein